MTALAVISSGNTCVHFSKSRLVVRTMLRRSYRCENELKEQVSCFAFEWDVAKFVDEEHIDAIERTIFSCEEAAAFRGDEPHE